MNSFCASNEIRTHTSFTLLVFETSASTIPPLRQVRNVTSSGLNLVSDVYPPIAMEERETHHIPSEPDGI